MSMQVNSMSLVFFSRNDTEEPEYFLWRYFPNMQSIIVCISSNCHDICGQHGCFGEWRGLDHDEIDHDERECMRLDLTAEKNEIRHQLGKYGQLWEDYRDALFFDEDPGESFDERHSHWEMLVSVDNKLLGNYYNWDWEELVLHQEHEHVDIEKEDDYTFSYQDFLHDSLQRTLRN